jgi:hypothetical protein
LPGGVFTEGDPMVPVPATEVSDDWLNAVQEEIVGVITAAEIDLDKADNGQLVVAISTLIAAQIGELNTWRKSNILVPRFWRSTTLPNNHAWANGDAITLSDWPEAKLIVDAGGLAGMLLPSDASTEIIAANRGKFRLSADGVYLYLPNLGTQFLRGWTPGSARAAGSWQQNAVQPGITSMLGPLWTTSSDSVVVVSGNVSNVFADGEANPRVMQEGAYYRMLTTVNQRMSSETAPDNIASPVILYLGRRPI